MLPKARVTVLPSGAVPIKPVSAAPPITVGTDGRIQGIDGMLDQIAGAAAKHVGPMLRRDVLPVIQNDKALQQTVGSSIGQQLAGPAWVVAASVAVIAGVVLFKSFSTPEPRIANPRRRLAPRRHRVY